MSNKWFLCLLCLLAMATSACSTRAQPIDLIQGETSTEADAQTAIDPEVKSALTQYLLEELEVKGPVWGSVVVTPLGDYQFLHEDHGEDQDVAKQVQIYRIHVAYAWIDGIAVMDGDQIVWFHRGFDLRQVYLANVDEDQARELCIVGDTGSGIVRSNMTVYDFSQHIWDRYVLPMDQGTINLTPMDDEDGLLVSKIKLLDLGIEADKTLMGRLALEDGKIVFLPLK